MLIRCVNDFKIKGKKYAIDDFKLSMSQNVWGVGKNMISPIDVLLHPNKHKEEYTSIKKANLDYSILFTENEVVDGYHRIAKTMMLGLPTILAIYVPNKVWEKCFLCKKLVDVDHMTAFMIMEMYDERFKKTAPVKKSAKKSSKKTSKK